MCFAPQRRPLFRHLNFQKCSDTEVFCTFWLGNVLRATTACTFSSSQFPKVDWGHHFFTLLTWKCASRHNGVNFSCLISPDGSAPAALASLLFDPPEPQIIGKNTMFCDYSTFSRTCIFFPLTLSSDSFSSQICSDLLSSFLLFFSSLLFSSLIFFLLIFSYLFFSFLLFSSLPSLHIVGSLTSKLPSTI